MRGRIKDLTIIRRNVRIILFVMMGVMKGLIVISFQWTPLFTIVTSTFRKLPLNDGIITMKEPQDEWRGTEVGRDGEGERATRVQCVFGEKDVMRFTSPQGCCR